MSLLSISSEWISPGHGPNEVGRTAGLLTIRCGDHFATRNEDEWSRSVHSFACVASYPLALWFVSSWWRLRWEPTPNGTPGVEWRMAHELPAAGCGFVWPRVTFDSDGENVDVFCLPTDSSSKEPVHYLERFRVSVGGSAWENAISDFVNLVLARLDASGIKNSELHALWQEVQHERRDPESHFLRRVEAELGFDPDDAPDEILKNFQILSREAGEAASFEIAPALATDSSEARVLQLLELGKTIGVKGQVEPPPPLLDLTREIANRDDAPWTRGWLLARLARSVWGHHLEPMSDEELSEILNADITKATKPFNGKMPLGLAVRSGPGSSELNFFFRRSNKPGRRFEAARFLADHLLAPLEDRWLPETDAKTARQKTQRAFAAEFLCPIEGLRKYLNNDFSSDAIENAGLHFAVSPLAIRSHLANNGLISPDDVVE
jgi:hypothetical protein